VEVIFELLFELVFQFFAEVLGNLGLEALDRVLQHRVARGISGAIVAVLIGFGAGWWWGNRHVALGFTEVPTALFVSLLLVVCFAVLCAVTAFREYHEPDRPDVEPPFFSADRWFPWRWHPGRLAAFALLNAAIAVGITVGFTPEDVPLR
jgi:hypothetical protein